MAAEYQSFMMEREEEMGEAWHEVGAEVCKLDCVCIVYPGACYTGRRCKLTVSV